MNDQESSYRNQQVRPGFFSPSGHTANRATVRSPQALDFARCGSIVPKGLGSLCQRKRAKREGKRPAMGLSSGPRSSNNSRETLEFRAVQVALAGRHRMSLIAGRALTPGLNFATARAKFGHRSTAGKATEIRPAPYRLRQRRSLTARPTPTTYPRSRNSRLWRRKRDLN